jgi:uncharacterized protein YdbL (DUF1318 family)
LPLRPRLARTRISTTSSPRRATSSEIAGKKLIENAPPGTYVKIDGKWVKKS